MPELAIRRLVAADLADYKALRDEVLAHDPDAFQSDAESEHSKEAADYLQRLGLDRADGGQFLIGAFAASGERRAFGPGRLCGAIGCERDPRRKIRHIGHVIGLMVKPASRGRGVGRALLEACIAEARQATGLEQLTLTVTAGNAAATGLYAAQGFVVYGVLPRAILVNGRYLDKQHLWLRLH